MSEKVTQDPDLLAAFNATYEKISGKGYKLTHHSNHSARRIANAAAWTSPGGVRELAVVDNLGIARSFAMVNGKGYVETINGMTEKDMTLMLMKVSKHIADTTPSTGEGSMYHHSTSGPHKVF